MISVLVVDDSPTFRSEVTVLLESDPIISVVGWASTGRQAVEAVMRLRPDIVTMDVMMPDLDGIQATELILGAVGVPIIVLTGADQGGVAVRALGAGAVEVLPKARGEQDRVRMKRELLRSIKLLSEVKVVRRKARGAVEVTPTRPLPIPSSGDCELVVVGASTGGPPIIHTLLKGLAADLPVPVIVVQHIAEGFEKFLVGWWNELSKLKVKLASPSEPLEPGTLFLAPAMRHVVVTAERKGAYAEPKPTDTYVPSVDKLFESVAAHYGPRAMGLLLSGMGDDGARGLAAMRAAGAPTAVQDPTTCVVDGMPQSALDREAAVEILRPSQMAPWILAGTVRRRSAKSAARADKESH